MTAHSLDAWTGYRWDDGLQIDCLCELDELSVWTRNNLYRIVVVAPLRGEVIVQGGRFFPELPAAKRVRSFCSVLAMSAV